MKTRFAISALLRPRARWPRMSTSRAVSWSKVTPLSASSPGGAFYPVNSSNAARKRAHAGRAVQHHLRDAFRVTDRVLARNGARPARCRSGRSGRRVPIPPPLRGQPPARPGSGRPDIVGAAGEADGLLQSIPTLEPEILTRPARSVTSAPGLRGVAAPSAPDRPSIEFVLRSL